jgi:outer membrane cobalamin receptor
MHWLKLAGSYSYDDSLVLAAPNAFDPAQIPGNRLIRRPVNSGTISSVAEWRRASVALTSYFSGQRTDSDFLGLGLTHTAGYARFDVATSYEVWRGITGYVRLVNLLNKAYEDALGYPALGRELRVGIKYRFGGRN